MVALRVCLPLESGDPWSIVVFSERLPLENGGT